MPAFDLPVYERTTCDCAGCRVGCKTMPGMCGVGDTEAIANHLGSACDAEFLTAHFEHSKGARMLVRAGGGIQDIRVPTINPAQKADGSCVFLDDNGYCRVHAVSPWGCRMFDVHQTTREGDDRMKAGIVPVMREQQARGQYFRQLRTLIAAGKQAQDIAQRRASFEIELRSLRSAGQVPRD